MTIAFFTRIFILSYCQLWCLLHGFNNCFPRSKSFFCKYYILKTFQKSITHYVIFGWKSSNFWKWLLNLPLFVQKILTSTKILIERYLVYFWKIYLNLAVEYFKRGGSFWPSQFSQISCRIIIKTLKTESEKDEKVEVFCSWTKFIFSWTSLQCWPKLLSSIDLPQYPQHEVLVLLEYIMSS